MKLLLLGAGGVGGYFGGRLAEGGADVTFLVRGKRREQLQRDGLRVRSQLGNIELPVKTVLAKELQPGYDLVLLTCKAYDLDSAMDAIAPAMNDTCTVLPLLNGIAHFEQLDRRFGKSNVIGGTCAISAQLQGDGTIHHAGLLQRMSFAERHGLKSPRVLILADALAKTKIDWELSDDIEQNLWEKLIFISALAAVSCLFRANIGEIMAAPGGRGVVESVLVSNIEIASREGRPPRSTAVDFARKSLTDPSAQWSASMLRDLEAGGLVESDHIVGWMLDKARKHGLESTVMSLAYTHLKAYEVRRAARRLPEKPRSRNSGL